MNSVRFFCDLTSAPLVRFYVIQCSRLTNNGRLYIIATSDILLRFKQKQKKANYEVNSEKESSGELVYFDVKEIMDVHEVAKYFGYSE